MTQVSTGLQTADDNGEGNMISQLTRTERQFAIIICTAVTLCGLAPFAAAPGDPLAVHGFIVLAFSIGPIFVVLSDRQSVVWGRRVSVRVDLGGRRIIKKKKT